MLCSRAEGMEDTGRLLDAVLVIDCSGSLDLPVTGTDPDKLALEAAGFKATGVDAVKPDLTASGSPKRAMAILKL